MNTKEMTCIGCPLGCCLRVVTKETKSSAAKLPSDAYGEVMSNIQDISISGNLCPKGEAYAIKEMTNPTRILTTTVKIKLMTEAGELSGDTSNRAGRKVGERMHQKSYGIVPVKTDGEIPKDKIMDCMAAIKSITVSPPIQIGDVVLKNVAGTGVDVVTTGNFRS